MPAKAVHTALIAVALVSQVLLAAAQEPAGPPPPSTRVEDSGSQVLELLPGIGRIGAQAGLMAGLSRNPYGVGRGVQARPATSTCRSRVPAGESCPTRSSSPSATARAAL